MATLKIRGIHSADTASVYSSDEVGTIDDTFLFPKWWDKKANNIEYIRVFKLHMTRVCDDIDIIIPANPDVEIRGDYDGNVTFRFDYHRGVERMALTTHNSTTVAAEYIFPKHPGQKPTYKEYVTNEGPTCNEGTVDQGIYYPEAFTSSPPDYISDTYAPYAEGSGDDLDGNSCGYPYDQEPNDGSGIIDCFA